MDFISWFACSFRFVFLFLYFAQSVAFSLGQNWKMEKKQINLVQATRFNNKLTISFFCNNNSNIQPFSPTDVNLIFLFFIIIFIKFAPYSFYELNTFDVHIKYFFIYFYFLNLVHDFINIQFLCSNRVPLACYNRYKLSVCRQTMAINRWIEVYKKQTWTLNSIWCDRGVKSFSWFEFYLFCLEPLYISSFLCLQSLLLTGKKKTVTWSKKKIQFTRCAHKNSIRTIIEDVAKHTEWYVLLER